MGLVPRRDEHRMHHTVPQVDQNLPRALGHSGELRTQVENVLSRSRIVPEYVSRVGGRCRDRFKFRSNCLTRDSRDRDSCDEIADTR